MKLTAHERKIVSRINKGEIWDIPSYLRSFGKGRDQAYDMDAIRSKFADDENGKKYKVMKDGKSLLTTTHSAMEIMGQTVYTPLPILRNESDIADDEWTLREAELDDKIPTSTFNYKEQEISIDFQKGAFVADDFKDILNFIRLWSYLRRENLVFEVDKPISKDEISMLYESVPCTKKRRAAQIKVEWDGRPIQDKGVEILKPVRSIHQTVPTRHAEEFMNSEWKINEDHLTMCREFLGKKMYPTEASHNYAANNYRTPDEVHRNLNSIVAVVALLISVFSFCYGLLHPSNTYQPALDNLTQQISEIQTALEDIGANQLTSEELDQIYGKLESIEESLVNAESSGVYSEIGELATCVEEIRNILAEQFPPTDPPKE